MPLIILRAVFMMVAAGFSYRLIVEPDLFPAEPTWLPYAVFAAIMLLSIAVISLDLLVPRKRLDTITAVYFGMIIGLFLTYVLTIAFSPVLPQVDSEAARWVTPIIGMVLCYLCISLLLQTKDDFRFIIPYVEFSREVKGLKPLVLDTSVIIDGRIADVVETNVMDTQLIMPRFVIAELQNIADSNDKLRRSRGRRGLDILNKLRSNPDVDMKIYDLELPEFAGQPVDMRLVLLAKKLDGKVVTGDYNLNKVAKLNGVDVINLNDVANALKPACLPGESLIVRVVKVGEESGQGIGYLDDGTMVVVEGGRTHLEQDVQLTVTSVLQKSAGRMIFGRFETETTA